MQKAVLQLACLHLNCALDKRNRSAFHTYRIEQNAPSNLMGVTVALLAIASGDIANGMAVTDFIHSLVWVENSTTGLNFVSTFE